jgi:hypothetical protein
MEKRGAEGSAKRLVSAGTASDRDDCKEMHTTNAARIHWIKIVGKAFEGCITK